MSLCKSYLLRAALLGLAGGLLACGSPSGFLGAEPTLSGQIEGWNRGPDFVLQASIVSAPATTAALTSAPIDAAGNFSITLPGVAALSPYLSPQHVDASQPIPGCTGTNIQISPQDFSSAVLVLKAVNATTKLSVTHGKKMPESVNVVYVYTDQPLTETGSLTCMFSATPIQETFDIHFGAGWNRQISTVGSSITVNTGPLPDGVVWMAQ
jgi:hypothetical protein